MYEEDSLSFQIQHMTMKDKDDAEAIKDTKMDTNSNTVPGVRLVMTQPDQNDEVILEFIGNFKLHLD